MYCPKCGQTVGSDDRFCRACGHSLAQSAMPRSAVTVPAGSTVLPSNAGPQLEPSSARSGYAGPPVIVVRSGKSAGLAAVLSFLWCGLGQIYNGQIGKGVALIVAYVVSWFLLFVLIGFLTTPALWIYGMVDAYRTAERLNREAGLPY